MVSRGGHVWEDGVRGVSHADGPRDQPHGAAGQGGQAVAVHLQKEENQELKTMTELFKKQELPCM